MLPLTAFEEPPRVRESLCNRVTGTVSAIALTAFDSERTLQFHLRSHVGFFWILPPRWAQSGDTLKNSIHCLIQNALDSDCFRPSLFFQNLLPVPTRAFLRRRFSH
eukprot:GHVU01224281.1.p2 GENE.GHVU01224281.1~~GHVU01224281.1.p2  ORF type:complete len:106 (-),score=1.90 GHVU01224281.1:222-539(-)